MSDAFWGALIPGLVTIIVALIDRKRPKPDKDRLDDSTSKDGSVSKVTFYREIDKVTYTYRIRNFIYLLALGFIGSFSGYSYFSQREVGIALREELSAQSPSINIDSLVQAKLDQGTYLTSAQIGTAIRNQSGWTAIPANDNNPFLKGCEYKIILDDNEEAYTPDQITSTHLRVWNPELLYVHRSDKTILSYGGVNTKNVTVYKRCFQ